MYMIFHIEHFTAIFFKKKNPFSTITQQPIVQFQWAEKQFFIEVRQYDR